MSIFRLLIDAAWSLLSLVGVWSSPSLGVAILQVDIPVLQRSTFRDIRGVLHDGSSTRSTKPDPGMVRRSLRQVVWESHVGEQPLPPRARTVPRPRRAVPLPVYSRPDIVTFTSSDDILDRLDALIERELNTSGSSPPFWADHTRSFHHRFDPSVYGRQTFPTAEVEYYPLLQEWQCRYAHEVVQPPPHGCIRHDAPPPRRLYTIVTKPPHGNLGKTDLAVGRLVRLENGEGILEQALHEALWEVKLNPVLSLARASLLYAGVDDEASGGIKLGLSGEDGSEPKFTWPDDLQARLARAEGDQTAVENMLQQILVQFDAYASSLLILSSFNCIFLFFRKSPSEILVSRPIISPGPPSAFDPTYVSDHNIFLWGSKPSSAHSPPIQGASATAGSWSPTKLITAVLLASGKEELRGFCRSGSLELFPGLEDRNPDGRDGDSVGRRDRCGTNTGRARPSNQEGGPAQVTGDMGRSSKRQGRKREQQRHVAHGSADEHNRGFRSSKRPAFDSDASGSSADRPVTPPSPLPGVLALDFVFAAPLTGLMETRHDLFGIDWPRMLWTAEGGPWSLGVLDPDKVEMPDRHQIDTNSVQDTFMAAGHSRMPVPRLRVVEHIGHGRLADAFRAHLFHPTLTPSSGAFVIVKLVDLETFSICGPNTHYDYDLPQAEEAVNREMDLYNGPLHSLQTSVVPRMFGAWKGTFGQHRKPVYCLVLEDAGENLLSFTKASPDVKAIIRQRTLEAYITLHDHGIIHGDLEPRHIRVRVPDRQTRWSPTLAVKVIDFEGAKLFRQDAALAARRAAEELKRVEDLLSAQGFTG